MEAMSDSFSWLRDTAQSSFIAQPNTPSIQSGYDTVIGSDYRRRLNSELESIEGTGSAHCYKAMWEFVNWCKEAEVPIWASAGKCSGSLVAFFIGISEIDPIPHDLIFEKFLNRQVRTPPPFLVHFEAESEELLRSLLTERFSVNISQTLADVSFLPFNELLGSDKSDLSCITLNSIRNLGVLERAASFMAGESLAPLGGVDRIPLNDKPTFGLLAQGDTAAIYPLDSEDARNMLMNFHPSSISDLAAVIAVLRPGPMELGIAASLCNRKMGTEACTPPHPLFAYDLEETYGVFIFQEQIMLAVSRIAGLPLEEADLMRRAIGKRVTDEVERIREIFSRGCATHGISNKETGELFDILDYYCNYTFCKAHALSSALRAYRTAYIKATFPAAFEEARATCPEVKA